MNRVSTEAALRLSILPARSSLTALCLLLVVSFPVRAADPCFYDGVSQSPLDYIIRQISSRYDTPAITDTSDAGHVMLAQPLGECSITEFLNIATGETPHWHYRLTRSGVVIYFTAEEKTSSVDKPLTEEIIVTGNSYIHDPSLASRYSSNTLIEQADIPAGMLSGHGDLTAAMTRLSTVAFTQEAGMDRNISIRGLSSDYSRVLVNGMPLLATSTSIDARGSVNNSRSFDFNVLPQGLFTQASVIKSGDARSSAGAIAGTVDLRTPMPLDSNARQGSNNQQWLSLQAEDNARNGAGGAAIAAGVKRVSDDHSRGWLLGISYRNRSTEEKGFSTVRWQAADWGEQNQLSADKQALLASGQVFSPRHNRYDILHRDQETLGVSAAYQWRDDYWGNIDVAVLGAQTRQEMHEYHISSSGLKYSDLSDVQVNDFAVNSAGMIYGDFSGVDVRSEHNHEVDETRIGQLKINWEKYLNTQWRVRSSLGYQNSEFKSPVHDKASLMAYDRDFRFDLRRNNRISVNRYGFDISDPGQWQMYSINLEEDEVTNQYRVASSEFIFDDGGDLKHYLGAQFQGFFNDREEAEYSGDGLSGPVGDYYQLTPGNYASGMGLAGLPHRWVVGSRDMIRAQGVDDDDLIADPLQQRKLNEYTWSLWWQTQFEIWQLRWPLRGDIGLRYSATRQQVRGSWMITDDAESVRTTNGYQDWLPSAHLVMTPYENLLLRFGYSRDIARPSIDDLTSPLKMRSSAQLVEGGNTNLDPSHAHAFDLSAEWYGRQGNFFSAGIFYKRIDSIVVKESQNVSLSELPYYNPLWDEDSQNGEEYTYVRPVNGPGTDITGLELTLNAPFLFLPAPLDRTGISLGYAFSRASVRYPDEENSITLPPPGLSRHVVNSELWYKTNHFRAGITTRSRSRYYTRVPAANGNDSEGVNASVIWGAYASWDINKQLTATLDGRNLTNEAFDLFVDSTDRVYSYSTTGTEVMLSFNWKFD
ncbi:MAG: hypothetical protein CMI02_08500 [Oceanospirillaceae bacterium]|nr:hypothetical protein [Oceanospirillaceae bacterium]MBT12062.1 hypothetical protein [Oceanospirillaceae bacterium]|tara:strand:+ start:19156 stop:22110 length:2955 start_codon:yes stop_codon:yes gene_type:complete